MYTSTHHISFQSVQSVNHALKPSNPVLRCLFEAFHQSNTGKVSRTKSQLFHPAFFLVQITRHSTHSQIHSLIIKHRMLYGVDFHNLLSPSVTFVSFITAHPENGTCKYLEDNRCYINISVLNKLLEGWNLHEILPHTFMLHKEHDVTSITNARSQNSVNSVVRKLHPETLRVSSSTFRKDNRHFLHAEGPPRILCFADRAAWYSSG